MSIQSAWHELTDGKNWPVFQKSLKVMSRARLHSKGVGKPGRKAGPPYGGHVDARPQGKSVAVRESKPGV